jgi:DNA-binding NarL/FixJ family response regulator
MIRVAIIEDDPMALSRIEDVLNAADDISVVATAHTLAEGERIVAAGAFDVLMCDLGLPDGSGISLVKMAAEECPNADVLVITVFADQAKVLDSIRAGASGYLLKDDRSADVVEGIREVRAGGSPISPIIARQLLRRLQPSRQTAPEEFPEGTLSERETLVLNLLARGLTYVEISETLEVTPLTVATYIKRIYRKLQVNSRGEAVFEASRRGIIDAL